MMKVESKNLRNHRRFSEDNKKFTFAVCLEKSSDCVESNKTGRRPCNSNRRLNSHMSLNSSSRNPYFYRSRGAHLQVNMGDMSTADVNKDCRQAADRFELKSNGIKLRSHLRDQKLKSSQVKISGRDNLKDVSIADVVKLESSADDSSDDSCTAWNSKTKQMSVQGENKAKSSVSRQLRDRSHNQTKVQDSKFGLTVRQHPYGRPKRNIIPKKVRTHLD